MRIFVFKLLFAYAGISISQFMGENPLMGIAVGVIFGHCLDLIATKKFNDWLYQRRVMRAAKMQFEQSFIGSLFFIFGKVCGCDGAIVKEEINALETIMKEQLTLSRSQRLKAISSFKAARKDHTPIQTKAIEYFNLYQDHTNVLESTVQMCLHLAAADGVINPDEESLIHTAASVFGITEDRFRLLLSPYLNGNKAPADLQKCYAILGCSADTTDTEVKRCYRKLVSSYHPDKIVSKDLPDDFMAFASQKMKDIQQAYETVKAQRGLS